MHVHQTSTFTTRTRPRSLRAVALLLASGTLSTVQAQNAWIGGSGDWDDPTNWTLGHTPEYTEWVTLGDQPGQAGSTVMMSYPGSGYDHLEISNGVVLDMNGGELVSFGQAVLVGANSRLIARPQPLGPNQSDFIGELHLGAGTYFDMRDNVPVTFWSGSESSGTITGQGYVKVGHDFSNNGIVRPGTNGGIVLDAAYFVDVHTFDLDGTTGDGQLQLDIPFSQLQVDAEALSDAFSGTINMAPGAHLAMNIADGWTADVSSDLNVAGFGNPANAAQITGTPMAFAGTMHVGGADGRLRLHNNTTFIQNALVDVGPGDQITTQNGAIIESGTFLVGQEGRINFDGATTVRGGDFTTASASLVDGGVFFNGDTEWQGSTHIDGAARQNGNATVSGALGATIDAGLFDMDGELGGTTWQINGPLTIHADRVGETASNHVDADITVAGGFLPRLAISLNDPASSWTMAGSMHLRGSSPFYETRVSGSPMIMQGDLTVDGKVQVTADTTLRGAGVLGDATVHIGAGDALRTQARTRVEGGVDFIGTGTLVNGASGTMLVADGVSLNLVALENHGALDIGDGPGIASA
ncbi:MAG: hypothetical protein KDA28_13150, partial [Phycisphaerales bacterium]|nr:hypothetical protein [Phycisphaerales bacterium]